MLGLDCCVAAVVILAAVSPQRTPELDHQNASPADSSRVILLPGIEVSEARPQDDAELRLRPGFARAYDVSQSHSRVRTVAEVLSGAVGVHVRQFGGVGSYSAVSIRGSSAGQVAVYLDGVPLNSSQYGVVNVADLPIEALERVDVFRGAAPLGLDSPGGGVINLVTRRVDGRWFRLSGGRGAFGTTRADVGAGWRRNQTTVMVVGQRLRSRGDFRYLDDNATPYNPLDDSLTTRRNNDLSLVAMTAKADCGLGPLTISLTDDYLSKDQGTPGIGANPALRSRFRTDRNLTNLLLSWANGRDSSRESHTPLRLRLYALEQRDRFSDPEGELTGLRQDNDDRTQRLGAQLVASAQFPFGQSLGLSVDGRQERYTPSIKIPAPRKLPGSERGVFGWAIEDHWTAPGSRLAFLGRLSQQLTEDDFPGGPPYPGAMPAPPVKRNVWQTSWTAGTWLDLIGGVSLKGSISKLFRMPTLEELFGNRGGIYGNPRAKPEDLATRDIGLVGFWTTGTTKTVFQPAWLDAQLSSYRTDASNLLVFVQNSQRSSVAQNISAARLEGLEFSFRSAWASGLSTDLSWTRQWTRDQGGVAYWHGKELPGRPRDELAIRVTVAQRHWQLGYTYHFLSKHFVDRANRTEVPARTLHDVTLTLRPWTNHLEWIAEGTNLTDRQIEDFAGFPLPGRALFLAVRLRLERKEQQP